MIEEESDRSIELEDIDMEYVYVCLLEKGYCWWLEHCWRLIDLLESNGEKKIEMICCLLNDCTILSSKIHTFLY